VGQSVAQARLGQQRPETVARAVDALGQAPPDPIRWLLLVRSLWKLSIGRGQGRRTGVLGLPQMPTQAATDHGREVDFLGETVAVLFLNQERGWQRQIASGQPRPHTLVPKRTAEAREGNRRDRPFHRTPLQTEAPMRGHHGLASHLRAHRARAQYEVGEDHEHRATRGARETPNGDTSKADAHIMRVAGQTPSPATGRLGWQLKAQRQEEGDAPFEKRLAVAKPLKVGRFRRKIDRDGTVFPWLCGCAWPGVPPRSDGVNNS
jgi:hypothetical protein